ncbi:MAG: YceI family protein [Bacteriovoracaceae bacterium]
MKFLITLSLLANFAFGADCQLQIISNDVKVQWTAFKTPSKVGVGGSFQDLGLSKNSYTSKTFKGLLEGVEFAINPASVDTKDSQRDKKIVSSFFNKVGKITGSIQKADQDSLVLNLKMNGVEKQVPMNVQFSGKDFAATGVIDVLDFAMNSRLKAMNQACFELHEGKTWNDVDLKLYAQVKKVCE